MVEDEFPRAVFGKPDGASAYQIIEQDPEFEDPEIAAAFRKICNSFEWKPIPAEPHHETCHGILRIGESVLVAEFQDSGRDASGRPHTLRVETIVSDLESLPVAWKKSTGRDQTPAVPADRELKVIGSPDTYWAPAED